MFTVYKMIDPECIAFFFFRYDIEVRGTAFSSENITRYLYFLIFYFVRPSMMAHVVKFGHSIGNRCVLKIR